MVTAVLSASAELIEFTSAEGYVDGELHGQNGWTTSALGVFVVTSDGGYVYRAGSGVRNLALDAGLLAGSVGTEYRLTSVMDFTYDVASDNTTAFYMNSFAAGSDLIRLRVRQSHADNKTFQFTLDTQNGTGSRNSEHFDKELLGFNGTTDTQSDRLQWNLLLKHEAGSTNWQVSGSVVNLDTDMTLVSWTEESFTHTTAFSEGVLNPDFFLRTGGPVDEFRIHSVEYSAIPEPATLGLFAIFSAGLLLARRIWCR